MRQLAVSARGQSGQIVRVPTRFDVWRRPGETPGVTSWPPSPALWTRFAGRAMARRPRGIADGVWMLAGGLPRRVMNVYLVEHCGQVMVFDTGVQGMAAAIRDAGTRLGGIERVVLSHAHVDHRGAAPRLGAPIWCHESEVADAE